MRKEPELDQIIEIEIVAGVDAKSEGVRELRGPRIPVERLASVHGAALKRASERFGIQLDSIAAHLRGPANGSLLRIHEEAHANAVVAQVRHRSRQRVMR